jgi:thymidylate synthase
VFLRADTLTDLYPLTIVAVLRDGEPTSPRGIPTREILGAHLRIDRPRKRVLDVEGRIPNPAFAVAEALWILSGSDDGWIFDYNSQLMRYADCGVLRGAYGPRLRRWGAQEDQLRRVVDLLLRDRDSRQAVVQIFDPSRDWAGAKDVPCTVGHRFFVRSGRLHLHTTMRSQDLWLGMPYDIFANTLLQELMAGWLGLEVGRYDHFVDSLHLYEHDVVEAETVTPRARPRADDTRPSQLRCELEELDAAVAGVLAGTGWNDDPAWRELADVLASNRMWRAGQRDGALRTAEKVGGNLGDALARWYVKLGASADVDLAARTTG